MAGFFDDPENAGGLVDIGTQLKLANQNMSVLIQTISSIFPRVTGSFTAAAASTTTVANADIAANSIVALFPTNAAARTLQAGANMLSVSATSAGVGFTAATAGGGSAVGTETFSYYAVNPV